MPGTASGLSSAGAQELKRGIITGIGDVNGDGFGDIVTGQDWDPSKDGSQPSVPESSTGGKVHVVYGTSDGPGTTVAVTQDTGNVPGASERGDWFGSELSLGDINGDGFQTDLVVGSARREPRRRRQHGCPDHPVRHGLRPEHELRHPVLRPVHGRRPRLRRDGRPTSAAT